LTIFIHPFTSLVFDSGAIFEPEGLLSNAKIMFLKFMLWFSLGVRQIVLVWPFFVKFVTNYYAYRGQLISGIDRCPVLN